MFFAYCFFHLCGIGLDVDVQNPARGVCQVVMLHSFMMSAFGYAVIHVNILDLEKLSGLWCMLFPRLIDCEDTDL